jgi:hypothetical protein|tara:strand:- start:171 stop:428 length:258 start_codon:yes stop_codon:yes gene_type:complete
MINKIRRNDMNELLHDIKVLDKLALNLACHQSLYGKDNYYIAMSMKIIKKSLAEKKKIVENFEKENMSYADYEEHMKGVGLNDVA